MAYHSIMLSTRTVKERALALGFDLAGIAPVGVWEDLESARLWAEIGMNGEMRYLENPKRFDPFLVLPSAKSVICVGLVYNSPLPYSTEVGERRSQEPGVRSQNEDGQTENPVSDSRPPIMGRNGQRTTDNGQFPFSNFHFPYSDSVPRAWISRYAWGRDYHEIMRAKLEQLRASIKESAPEAGTRVFVDTGPVVERAFARFSGIGWMGKNTCILNEEKGSWFFLGVILCSLELEPDVPAPDRCGSCTACLEACPTGALIEPYAMDAARCISYLTIELRGSIPKEFRSKIGGNVFGCDICQDVCPWNKSPQLSANSFQQAIPAPSHPAGRSRVRQAATTKVPQFHPMIVGLTRPAFSEAPVSGRPSTSNGAGTTDDGQRTRDHGPAFSLFNPPLEALASITEENFRLNFAQSPIKRAKYRGWLRNLCVAMGNSGDERFVSWLERAARHPDPIVREHAAWALNRLRGK